jgi:maleylacetoacetate isomerase
VTTYTLYGYWRSSATFRVRAALELKGLPYTYQAVHLVKEGGEQLREAYRELNPMGEVPTLAFVTSEGERVALAQSVAILEYLEATHPVVPLLPEGALAQARVRQLVEGVNSGIHPLQNLKVLRYLASLFGTDQAAHEAWARHWIAQGFAALEVLVGRWGGRHAYGDLPTLADCAIVPQVYNARRYHLDLAPFPRMSAIWEAAMALPAFQRAAPEAQPDAPAPA